VVEAYAATAAARGVAPPEEFVWAKDLADRIEAARGPQPLVPCHDDLLNANFIDDGTRIRIVDWEYAGMGDRWFDLGNFAVNNELDDDQETLLLEAYFGEPPDDRRRATLKLFRFMSDFREGMWGVVQAGVSELEFDFRDYAQKHFDRLEKARTDPRFEGWIEEARS
jgi:thiamine kinase-like enzyme